MFFCCAIIVWTKQTNNKEDNKTTQQHNKPKKKEWRFGKSLNLPNKRALTGSQFQSCWWTLQPFSSFGIDGCVKTSVKSGIGGLIVVNLPPKEASEVSQNKQTKKRQIRRDKKQFFVSFFSAVILLRSKRAKNKGQRNKWVAFSAIEWRNSGGFARNENIFTTK